MLKCKQVVSIAHTFGWPWDVYGPICLVNHYAVKDSYWRFSLPQACACATMHMISVRALRIEAAVFMYVKGDV